MEAEKETNCTRCAVKHIAKAEALLDEAKLGYPQNFFRCLANLSLAEDHTVEKYPAFAAKVRDHRKNLEMVPTCPIPWDTLILECSLLEGHDVSVVWPVAVPDEFENRYAEPPGFSAVGGGL